jgi:hypothetical protein
MQDSQLVTELKRQNRWLKAGLALAGGALAVVLLAGAGIDGSHARFAEIDVERINVVAANGQREIVIANRQRLPDPVIEGKTFKGKRGQVPGLIFYNAVGDENGGLVFDDKLDEQGRPAADMQLSMDRFGGDQQVALSHSESDGTMESGLKVYDSGPGKEWIPLVTAYEQAPDGAEKQALQQKLRDYRGREVNRVFVGKTRAKSSAVVLADATGRPRIRMEVTQDGNPSLEFLDDSGKVTQHFPQRSGR